ncbi:hypothetical protein [Novosphingobium olei]|uniref:hypothetical protein n=1 Tax=Novosphingobium olei TaxID=2728851 RepID=UPI00308F2292|nr:hypothetical protein NSDW_27470 [Novosphingobium olei]
MRRLLAALVAFCLLPSPAFAKASWPEGLWRGTLGTAPVQVCLERNGLDELQGSYFYLRHLRPIALRLDGKLLQEDGGAIWTLRKGTGANLEGTWQRAKRTLPIRLMPVAWKPAETWDGPCGSRAFIAPRLKPVTISHRAPQGKASLGYDELHYDVGAAFDSVDIASFALKPQLPGDAAINAAVALDPLKPGSIADFAECMASNLSSLGTDGDFSLALTPQAVRGDFLTVAVAQAYFCGGAHPDAVTTYRTFDRRTGKEFALADWLASTARQPIDGDTSAGSLIQPTEALRKVILAHFPRPADDTEGCFDLVAGSEFWTVSLTSDGFAFEPSLPHVAAACGDVAALPFAALAPYLSSAGKAGAARITRR